MHATGNISATKATIGVAGPVSLKLLKMEKAWPDMPKGYSFPMTANLVNYLLEMGHKVVVYNHSPEIKTARVYSDEKLTICVAPHNTQLSKIDFSYSLSRKILKLMRKHPSDGLIVNWSYEFAVAALKTNKPNIVILHDDARVIYKLEANWRKFQRMIIDAFVKRKADKLVTVSPYIYRNLPPHVQQKTQVIPNYIHDAMLENYLPFDKKQNRVMSVCNASEERKNIRKSVLAFGKVIQHEKWKDLKYVLIGSGFEPNGVIYNFIKKEQIPLENFEFAGPTEFSKTIKRMADCRLFIHPSLEESFGMAVVEAMGVGTPVIGGKDSGNIPDILAEGRGVTTNVQSVDDLSQTILTCLENSDQMQEIANTAYSYVKNNLLTSTVVPKLLSEIKLTHNN